MESRATDHFEEPPQIPWFRQVSPAQAVGFLRQVSPAPYVALTNDPESLEADQTTEPPHIPVFRAFRHVPPPVDSPDEPHPWRAALPKAAPLAASVIGMQNGNGTLSSARSHDGHEASDLRIGPASGLPGHVSEMPPQESLERPSGLPDEPEKLLDMPAELPGDANALTHCSSDGMFGTASSTTSSVAVDIASRRLNQAKQKGHLRLLRLRVPVVSTSTVLGLVALYFMTPLVSVEYRTSGVETAILTASVFVFSLAFLPSDRRFLHLMLGFLIAPGAFGAGIILVDQGLREPLYRTDQAQNAWPVGTDHGICSYMGALVAVCLSMWCFGLLSRKLGTKDLLRQWWLAWGVANLVWAFQAVISVLLTLASAEHTYLIRDSIHTVHFSTLAFLSLDGRLVKRVQSWLMFRGEAGAAAAGIAQLLGGWSPEKVLAVAKERFVYVSADNLLQEDMADNLPNPQLRRFTKKGHLGNVDCFLSHSWHDSADLKWTALQEWREEFRIKHGGKEPKLWIDKYCIDQSNIEESLACLPVYLAGCKELVVLCGKTYLDRLWCLVEIMVFLEMGGQKENLHVKLLEGTANPRASTSSLHALLEEFDPRKAHCFDPADTERLHDVIQVTGYECISQLVHETFLA